MTRKRGFGPGLLVTAAFIGPGTVTTASRAGAEQGYALLWSILFAVVATIVLQEMAARLGLVTRQGLGDALRTTFRLPIVRIGAVVFVVLAIGFGNAAYQTGNLTGASLGLTGLFGGTGEMWAFLLALAAFLLLLSGTYKWIERVLIALVVLMSLVFILTAVLVAPPAEEVLQGMVPSLPAGSLGMVIGLIGTTVVPYNLFLHADSVQSKWPAEAPVDEALAESRLDTCLAVVLGGAVTMAIVVTAAAAFHGRGGFPGLLDTARQLEPILGGPAARILFAVGLFAAGLTSTITAPLAAAYAISGALGWQRDLKSARFRAVWMAVLLAGLAFALALGKSPSETIIAAQILNGLLLPVIAVFLLCVVNRADLLGAYRNRWPANLAGIVVVGVAAVLGLRGVLQQFGIGVP